MAAASIEHPALPLGLSADILMRVDKQTVLQIVKVRSLDIVTHPARGGKFVRVLQSQRAGQPPARPAADMNRRQSKGDRNMDDEKEEVIEEQEQEQPTPETIQAETLKQTQLQKQMEASDNLLKEQCKYLLTAALSASRLPEVTQSRVRQVVRGDSLPAGTAADGDRRSQKGSFRTDRLPRGAWTRSDLRYVQYRGPAHNGV